MLWYRMLVWSLRGWRWRETFNVSFDVWNRLQYLSFVMIWYVWYDSDVDALRFLKVWDRVRLGSMSNEVGWIGWMIWDDMGWDGMRWDEGGWCNKLLLAKEGYEMCDRKVTRRWDNLIPYEVLEGNRSRLLDSGKEMVCLIAYQIPSE